MKENISLSQVVILMSKILKKHGCTYMESEEILYLLISEFKAQKQELEYKTFQDFINNHKTFNADNVIVSALAFSSYYPEID